MPEASEPCRQCGSSNWGTPPSGKRYCRPCHAVYQRRWYEKNRERRLAAIRAYREENPERVKARSAEQHKRHAQKRRNRYFLRTFGITLEQYDEMVQEQGGVCAICLQAEWQRDRRTGELRRLAVDHCHATGRVRGLLCANCNRAIGLLADDAARVDRLAAYLRTR